MPLLGNKGAHINNGDIAPGSPSSSTTQEETIPDIQNTSISQASGDFGCFEKRVLHFVHLNARSILQFMITRYVSLAIAYSANIETVREGEFVCLSATILILIGGVTLIMMIWSFWL